MCIRDRASVVLLFELGVAAPQPWGELLVGLSALPMPLAMGVAALRHRLWDVDLAISTGLRYACLLYTSKANTLRAPKLPVMLSPRRQ